MSLFRVSRLARFAAEAPTGVTNRLLLTMGSPRQNLYLKKAVDSVTVPGAEGTMTLTNNHSMLVSMLKAGTITVREGSETNEYFVSDGFVFFNHPSDDSGCCRVEISGVELVPTSHLDKERAAQLLTELNAGPKDTEWDKVKIQLGSALLNQVIKSAQAS